MALVSWSTRLDRSNPIMYKWTITAQYFTDEFVLFGLVSNEFTISLSADLRKSIHHTRDKPIDTSQVNEAIWVTSVQFICFVRLVFKTRLRSSCLHGYLGRLMNLK